MASLLKTAANFVLLPFGVHVARTTPPDPVRQIVALLAPIDPGIELVRIGGDNDGGYLVPNDLEGIAYCFSAGIADIVSFEIDCLTRGIRSFLADFSVDTPPIDLKEYKFTKKFVGAVNNSKYMSLDRWVNASLGNILDDDLILQMDIEGAEYETLLSTPKSILEKFRILIIEFHNVESVRDKNFCQIVLSTLQKIKENFEIVHIHPNNCCGITSINGVAIPNVFEVTLLRKDRIKSRNFVNKLPHPLDQPNDPSQADITFPNLIIQQNLKLRVHSEGNN